MTEALDQIAQAEGFNTWSLLQPKVKAFTPKTKEDLLNHLHPGDLLLIDARPGLGKTTLTLQLLLQAIKIRTEVNRVSRNKLKTSKHMLKKNSVS